jgi:hypothetical protein
MNARIIVCHLMCALFIFSSYASGGGRYAEVYVASGSRYAGELLSVRDTSIVLGLVVDAPESHFIRDTSALVIVGKSEIKLVSMGGSSYYLLGGVLGLLGGGLIGGAIGGASSPDSKNPLTGLVEKGMDMSAGILLGGLGGCVVGLLVGGAASSRAVEYQSERGASMDVLRPYARYQFGEPGFLKQRR